MKGPIKAWLTELFTKLWIKVLAGAVLLLFLLMALLPSLIGADSFRPRIERDLSQSLNRPVQVGNLSLSFLTSSLVADNLTIGDDPRFSSSPFLQAKALHIGIEPWPLLFKKKVVVTRLVADRPVIHLVRSNNGVWNFSSLSRRLENAAAPDPTSGNDAADGLSAPDFALARFAIHHGTVTVESEPREGRPVYYQDVDMSARQQLVGSRMSFQITANLPADGVVRVNGTLGEISVNDVSDTPFQADIAMKSFNPVAAGIIEKDQGFSLVADLGAKAISDGRFVHTTGTAYVRHLQVVKNGAPDAQPVDVTYDIESNLPAHTGQVRNLQIKLTDSQGASPIVLQASGSYVMAPKLSLDIRLSARQLPIDQLQTILPALGVKLPRGSTLNGGTASTDLTISGLAAAPELNGSIDVADTTLRGFNLSSRLEGLSALSGMMGGGTTGNSTPIQSLRSNVAAGSDGVRIDNFYAAIPTLGTATGAGTISPVGDLNFDLMVKLSGRSKSGDDGLGILSGLGGLLGRTVAEATPDGIPLKVSGTQQDPRFHLSLPQFGSTQHEQPFVIASNKAPAARPRNAFQSLFASKNH